MGGRKGLDARCAIGGALATRAAGDGGATNWQGPVLAMTNAPGAAPHLQASATQHAGLFFAPVSFDTEAEPPAKDNAAIPVDGCDWAWHPALDPCAASPGIDAIACDVNAIPTCQSSRVANTVPR